MKLAHKELEVLKFDKIFAKRDLDISNKDLKPKPPSLFEIQKLSMSVLSLLFKIPYEFSKNPMNIISNTFQKANI